MESLSKKLEAERVAKDEKQQALVALNTEFVELLDKRYKALLDEISSNRDVQATIKRAALSLPQPETTLSPDDVEIVRLHPTRSYDLEDVDYGEAFSQSFALSLAGSGTAGSGTSNVSATLNRQAVLEAQARQRFLSRISKNVSFADAGTHSFGWNFYPSNLQVERVGGLRKSFDFLFGTPRQYEVTAHLEGGARDCMVYIIVPTDWTSIKCKLETSYSPIDPEDGGEESYIKSVTAERSFSVPLPPYDEIEVVAMRALTHGTSNSSGRDDGLPAVGLLLESLLQTLRAATPAPAAPPNTATVPTPGPDDPPPAPKQTTPAPKPLTPEPPQVITLPADPPPAVTPGIGLFREIELERLRSAIKKYATGRERVELLGQIDKLAQLNHSPLDPQQKAAVRRQFDAIQRLLQEAEGGPIDGPGVPVHPN